VQTIPASSQEVFIFAAISLILSGNTRQYKKSHAIPGKSMTSLDILDSDREKRIKRK